MNIFIPQFTFRLSLTKEKKKLRKQIPSSTSSSFQSNNTTSVNFQLLLSATSTFDYLISVEWGIKKVFQTDITRSKIRETLIYILIIFYIGKKRHKSFSYGSHGYHDIISR